MNQRAPRSGTSVIHLAWTREQIGLLPDAGSVVAPLSPPAMGAALKRSLRLAADPLALLDSGYGADEMWLRTEALTATVQARLAPLRRDYFAEFPRLAEPALDQSALMLWSREILHLRAVLTRLQATIGQGCEFVVPNAPAATLHEARMAQAVALVLAEMGIVELGLADPGADVGGQVDEAWPDTRQAGRHSKSPDGLGEIILVGSFGVPDPIGLLARLRRKSGAAIILLAEREFSHLEHFERNWERLAARFAPIHLVVPGRASRAVLPPAIPPLADENCDPARDAGCRIATALAHLLIREAWPRRRAAAAAVAGVFRQNTIRHAVISDHVSDSGFAIAAQAGVAACRLTLETHSGLAIPKVFWLAPLIDTPATLSAWTPSLARHHRLALGEKAGITRTESQRPNAFGHRWVNWGTALFRALKRPRQLSTIGIFLTTGQAGFAPDIPLALHLEALRAFVMEGVAHGLRFSFRLRAFEDDPDMLRWFFGQGLVDKGLAAQDMIAHCEVHRIGERPLGAFLAGVDVVVEAGTATSASLIAMAHRVPVFRLGTGMEDAARPSGLGVPALAAGQACAELLRLAGTRSLRLSRASNQIKILE